MNYDQLIDNTRFRKSSNPNPQIHDPKRDFDSDRGRVIFSAPLRRLQSKAQVFSLESNAAVRSRLTHSMEVAHIGRYIVHQLGWLIERQVDLDVYGIKNHLPSIEVIVETACLLHDIGNPPFGHLGEKAIQNWFDKESGKLYAEAFSNKKSLFRKKKINKSRGEYKDFIRFDGNPHGLRIVMKLQGVDDNGLNLTYTQLAAMIKYPVYSTEQQPLHKKVGVFQSELSCIEKVWTELGLAKQQRHPLVFLMEAADDIAYCLSDIEDGIEKHIVYEESVLIELKYRFSIAKLVKFETFAEMALQQDTINGFILFRTKVINELTEYCAKIFLEEQDKILSRADVKSLLGRDDDNSKALKIIKEICTKRLYRSAAAEDIEIAGYNIVYGILDKFSILMTLSRSDFSNLVEKGKCSDDLCRRLYSKLPKQFIDIYKIESDKKNDDCEWYCRMRLLIDFVAGMTDDFALKVFRLLNGIEIETL